MRHLLSHRAATSTSSAIRDLLRLTEQPGILSLAGGLPSSDGFPLDELRTAAIAVLDAGGPYGSGALQYGRTEGLTELRRLIATRSDEHLEHVVVTTGSQQALDLVGRCLVDPGDVVVVESPSYVGALQAFEAHGARFAPVAGDSDGLDTAELERRLLGGLRPVLCYVVPNFANPTGATLSLARREHLLSLARQFGFVIVEDDPYRDLRFRGERVPSIRELPGAAEHVVMIQSTSKTLAPGLRIGWAVLPAWLVDAVVIAKQAVDLHTPALSQHLAVALLSDEAAHAERTAEIARRYARQAEALQLALTRHLGAEIDLSPVDGGMFVWGRFVDTTVDTTALLTTAIACGVAFVPGAAFHPRIPGVSSPRHELRLSFATLPAPVFDEAARRLAMALRSVHRDAVPAA